MTIGIDLEKLRNHHSGLGQFAYHLAGELAKIEGMEKSFYLPKEEHGSFGNTVEYIDWQRYHQFVGIPLVCDVWHSIHQEAKYFPRKAAKKLLTIHDLNFLQKYSGLKRERALKKLQALVNKMDGVAFISKHTQSLCQDHLDFRQMPQKVIYNGLTVNVQAGNQKPDLVRDRPFLFTMGIISEKKNFHVLIDAMHHLPDLDLYIAGNAQSDYAQKITSTIAEGKLDKRIKLLGEVNEAQKNWLYQYCDAFIFPSLAEGFGLPVLEALSYGKPTITSNLGALPEIGGGHTVKLENFSAKHIATQIVLALSKHTDAAAIKAHEYAKSYSWHTAAKQYMQFYHDLANQV